MVRCGNSFAPMTELNLAGPGLGQIFVVPLAYRYEVPFDMMARVLSDWTLGPLSALFLLPIKRLPKRVAAIWLKARRGP